MFNEQEPLFSQSDWDETMPPTLGQINMCEIRGELAPLFPHCGSDQKTGDHFRRAGVLVTLTRTDLRPQGLTCAHRKTPL